MRTMVVMASLSAASAEILYGELWQIMINQLLVFVVPPSVASPGAGPASNTACKPSGLVLDLQAGIQR